MTTEGQAAIAAILDRLDRERVPSFDAEVVADPDVPDAARATISLRISESHRATVRWNPDRGYDIWRGDETTPAGSGDWPLDEAVQHLVIALLKSSPGRAIADHLLRDLEAIDTDSDHPAHAVTARAMAAILRENGLGEEDIDRLVGGAAIPMEEATHAVTTSGGGEITDLTPVSRAAMMRTLAARALREGVAEEPSDPHGFADAVERCLDEASRADRHDGR